MIGVLCSRIPSLLLKSPLLGLVSVSISEYTEINYTPNSELSDILVNITRNWIPDICFRDFTSNKNKPKIIETTWILIYLNTFFYLLNKCLLCNNIFGIFFSREVYRIYFGKKLLILIKLCWNICLNISKNPRNSFKGIESLQQIPIF